MAQSSKKQDKMQRHLSKQAENMFSGLEKLSARKFTGFLDRFFNVVFSVAASAGVVIFSLFGIPNLDLNNLATNLFVAADGLLSSLGSWGTILAVFVLSTFFSKGSIKIPKFLKKLTVRPGLAASSAVLVSLPVALESNTISKGNMILIAFVLIFYSCFASRSNIYNLSLNKATLSLDGKLDSVGQLISGNTVDIAGAERTMKQFVKMAKGVSSTSSKASRNSNIFIFVASALITAAWTYFINVYSVEIVSSVAVLSLTTVMEIIEAFKGPNVKDNTVDISKERVTAIYNQVQRMLATTAEA